VKYYSVDIVVDFDTPREMPQGSGRPWKAAGYFQYFYCTESSKEKAKQVVLDFVRKREVTPESSNFKCDRIAWMRSLEKREQIVRSCTADLTDELFQKRNEIGIWSGSMKYAGNTVGRYAFDGVDWMPSLCYFLCQSPKIPSTSKSLPSIRLTATRLPG